MFRFLLVAISALALLAAVAIVAPAQTPSPTPAGDDPILQACEACANRLKLSETTLAAVQAQLADAREIIAAKDKIIGQQDSILTRYEKMTANSGRIENIDDRRVEILQTQLGDVQRKLERCQSNEKWIAGVSLIGGLALGYKLHGITGSTGSTLFAQYSPAYSFQYVPSFFERSREDQIRKALQAIK